MTMTPAALIERFGSPLYVYDVDTARARARALAGAVTYQPFKPFYAVKANSCPMLVRAIVGEGYGIDAVSPGEVALAIRLGVPPEQILYTENNMTDAEMAAAMRQRVLINCGSLDRLRRLADAGGAEASVRINPDVSAGSHEKICTAGPMSKFGIHYSQINDVRAVEQSSKLKVTGCHMHIGSGFLDADAFVKAMGVVLAAAAQLPSLRFIDFGGGIGIPYEPGQKPMDLRALGSQASALMAAFVEKYGCALEMRLEPGRFLVAEAGTLYATVTSVKQNPDGAEGKGRLYVGCDSGFNHLIRPCMYDAWHRIENVSRPQAAKRKVDVVGNICESGDVFARDRELPMPEIGDILAIRDAGAYGMSMASTYNTRPLPAEVVITNGEPRLARARQTPDQLLDEWIW